MIDEMLQSLIADNNEFSLEDCIDLFAEHSD
jgi:hypothetical protein